MTYLTDRQHCKSKEQVKFQMCGDLSKYTDTVTQSLRTSRHYPYPINMPGKPQRRQNATPSITTFPTHPKHRYMVSANLSWHMHGATQSSPAHGHDATAFSARNSSEITGTGSYPVRTRFCLWFCASPSAPISSSSNSSSSSRISSSTLTLRSWYRLAVARFWRAISLPPGL